MPLPPAGCLLLPPTALGFAAGLRLGASGAAFWRLPAAVGAACSATSRGVIALKYGAAMAASPASGGRSIVLVFFVGGRFGGFLYICDYCK